MMSVQPGVMTSAAPVNPLNGISPNGVPPSISLAVVVVEISVFIGAHPEETG